eukprot:GHVN01031699.1.p1 GENE.GHVN01031699.1~~GHVN01031699.1.p1  ORF type:complete len:1149 (-),score=144.54 GHVN01031699.1:736-4182(-)
MVGWGEVWTATHPRSLSPTSSRFNLRHDRRSLSRGLTPTVTLHGSCNPPRTLEPVNSLIAEVYNWRQSLESSESLNEQGCPLCVEEASDDDQKGFSTSPRAVSPRAQPQQKSPAKKKQPSPRLLNPHLQVPGNNHTPNGGGYDVSNLVCPPCNRDVYTRETEDKGFGDQFQPQQYAHTTPRLGSETARTIERDPRGSVSFRAPHPHSRPHDRASSPDSHGSQRSSESGSDRSRDRLRKMYEEEVGKTAQLMQRVELLENHTQALHRDLEERHFKRQRPIGQSESLKARDQSRKETQHGHPSGNQEELSFARRDSEQKMTELSKAPFIRRWGPTRCTACRTKYAIPRSPRSSQRTSPDDFEQYETDRHDAHEAVLRSLKQASMSNKDIKNERDYLIAVGERERSAETRIEQRRPQRQGRVTISTRKVNREIDEVEYSMYTPVVPVPARDEEGDGQKQSLWPHGRDPSELKPTPLKKSAMATPKTLRPGPTKKGEGTSDVSDGDTAKAAKEDDSVGREEFIREGILTDVVRRVPVKGKPITNEMEDVVARGSPAPVLKDDAEGQAPPFSEKGKNIVPEGDGRSKAVSAKGLKWYHKDSSSKRAPGPPLPKEVEDIYREPKPPGFLLPRTFPPKRSPLPPPKPPPLRTPPPPPPVILPEEPKKPYSPPPSPPSPTPPKEAEPPPPPSLKSPPIAPKSPTAPPSPPPEPPKPVVLPKEPSPPISPKLLPQPAPPPPKAMPGPEDSEPLSRQLSRKLTRLPSKPAEVLSLKMARIRGVKKTPETENVKLALSVHHQDGDRQVTYPLKEFGLKEAENDELTAFAGQCVWLPYYEKAIFTVALMTVGNDGNKTLLCKTQTFPMDLEEIRLRKPWPLQTVAGAQFGTLELWVDKEPPPDPKKDGVAILKAKTFSPTSLSPAGGTESPAESVKKAASPAPPPPPQPATKKSMQSPPPPPPPIKKKTLQSPSPPPSPATKKSMQSPPPPPPPATKKSMHNPPSPPPPATKKSIHSPPPPPPPPGTKKSVRVLPPTTKQSLKPTGAPPQPKLQTGKSKVGVATKSMVNKPKAGGSPKLGSPKTNTKAQPVKPQISKPPNMSKAPPKVAPPQEKVKTKNIPLQDNAKQKATKQLITPKDNAGVQSKPTPVKSAKKIVHPK